MWVRTLGRKVDCPIVGKERPIESESFLPCPDVPTPVIPLLGADPNPDPNPVDASTCAPQL